MLYTEHIGWVVNMRVKIKKVGSSEICPIIRCFLQGIANSCHSSKCVEFS